MIARTLLASAIVVAMLAPARAHDPANDPFPQGRDERIALGARVHGGFGSLIALGLRIGAESMSRLNAGPREIDVTYFEGEGSPCACVADGIMLATVSTPGQRLLRVSVDPAGVALFGRILMVHRPTGRRVEVRIPLEVWPGLRDINREPPVTRWNYVMHADRGEHFEFVELP